MAMHEFDGLFDRLSRSDFRRRFALGDREKKYLAEHGMAAVLAHAADFVATRLAPAAPVNDGKQTPMRGHPVFIAQHATGTCCRSCLAKWHGIERGREMNADERAYVVAVIGLWLARQGVDASARVQGRLF